MISGNTGIFSKFAVTDLSIMPSEVYVDDSLSISVIITNTGGQSGSYELILKIDDAIESTQLVTLAPGLSKQEVFTVSEDVAGSHLVNLNGLTGRFMVKVKVPPAVVPPPVEPINWWLVGGAIVGGLAVGLLIFFLMAKRRAY